MKYLKVWVRQGKGIGNGFSTPSLSAGLANKNHIIYNYPYTVHVWKYWANTTLQSFIANKSLTRECSAAASYYWQNTSYYAEILQSFVASVINNYCTKKTFKPLKKQTCHFKSRSP